MLHITNGDIAAAAIRGTGVIGQVVPWRDVLHEGPVPSGLPLEAMSEVRARFISGAGGGNFPAVMRQFGARDAALRGARRMTLWFEHDLYDQLQLLQILATLAQQTETSADLIQIDAFPGVAPFYGLGQLTPAQLATLWPMRRPVTAAQLTLALRGWKAFTAPDPAALRAFLASDTTALPFLHAALTRLLEDIPVSPDGLGRTDRQLLAAVAAGHQSFDAIFKATQAMEAAPFHGDTTIQVHLEALANGPSPLLTREPQQLTEAGRRVLAGEADARLINPIDRWIGGVHIRT